eukprot:TRINITY_DN112539_c0_g1_i1.p3 TRINITY_DN112539_c0_g1~~TRINITY_DN112539_c0_g1_i1.p3  ORF type:complete len:107 (+),score=5.48 TRINITY_DN112539_c0_g1_i1:490-810(+)
MLKDEQTGEWENWSVAVAGSVQGIDQRACQCKACSDKCLACLVGDSQCSSRPGGCWDNECCNQKALCRCDALALAQQHVGAGWPRYTHPSSHAPAPLVPMAEGNKT